MEGVEVCTSPCGIRETGALVCDHKSRAARRRRMEIRRFKLVATTPSVVPSLQISRKRPRLPESDSGFAISDTSQAQRDSQTELAAARNQAASASTCEEDAVPPHGFKSICGRRKDMEDAVTVLPDFNSAKRARLEPRLHLFGVYDGHGGSEAALFCKNRLHEVLAGEMESRGSMSTETQWREAMSSCFSLVDTEVLSGGFMCRNENKCEGDTIANDCICGHTIALEAVGTTAIVAVVDSKSIIVANCGDSRAVLSRGGQAVALSVDHKPDRPDEMARIEAAGGHVIFWDGPRVSGVLAMSRAIGDKYLKPYVISEPEVTVTERTDEDEFLVLASDGLWDVLSNELVCEVARKCLAGRLRLNAFPSDIVEPDASPSSAAAALLTQLALAKGSQDNISVVVVDLKRHQRIKRSATR